MEWSRSAGAQGYEPAHSQVTPCAEQASVNASAVVLTSMWHVAITPSPMGTETSLETPAESMVSVSGGKPVHYTVTSQTSWLTTPHSSGPAPWHMLGPALWLIGYVISPA